MASNKDDAVYLNPLALESALFLKNFEKLRENHGAVDGVLLHILHQIILNVDKFLEERSRADLPKPITEINLSSLEYVKRSYRCIKCKNVYDTLQSAVTHVHKKCNQENIIANISLNNGTKTVLTYKDESEFLQKLRLAEKLQSLQEYDVINKHLTNALQKAFPKQPVKIYLYGSRIAGISNRRSDIDMYVEINNSFRSYAENPSSETKKKLDILFGKLSKSKNWKQLLNIQSARVPIIKALHAPTGIKCDISVTSSLCVVNTHLMAYLFELQPLARCLCIHFKEWMLLTQINTFMNSYSLALMVVFFLQTQNLLPSVKVLQEKLDFNKDLTVGPWLATFNCYSRCELNIEMLPVTLSCCRKYMKMFFNYYINFDYNKFVLCPYLGKEVEFDKFKDNMPERYKLYTKNNPNEHLYITKPVVIQDPFRLNRNVLKNLQSLELAIIIKYMCLSEKVL